MDEAPNPAWLAVVCPVVYRRIANFDIWREALLARTAPTEPARILPQ